MDRTDMGKTHGMRLLLSRCGMTEWDRTGRVQGATDLPLSDGGRAEVDQRARALEGVRLGEILSAPDEASLETARVIARSVGARVDVHPELAELSAGLWEGLTCAELEQRCRAGRTFMDEGMGVVPPGASQSLADYARELWPKLVGAVNGARVKGAGVGLVIRPIALGVCRCILEDASLDEIWGMVRDRPADGWYTLDRVKQPASSANVVAAAGSGLTR